VLVSRRINDQSKFDRAAMLPKRNEMKIIKLLSDRHITVIDSENAIKEMSRNPIKCMENHVLSYILRFRLAQHIKHKQLESI